MKFREYVLSSGRIVSSGKDSSTNDELVSMAKSNDTLLHTLAPGSPFVNCGEKPSRQEIHEASIFCAKYSQDWKKNKRDMIMNVFSKKDMKKDNTMKEGTWEVKKSDTIKVKKEEIKKLEEELLHETHK